MLLKIERNKENPIIRPGKYNWRKATVFNPAAIYHNEKFYILERAAGALVPHCCVFGLLESDNGIHFKHVVDYPVFTAKQLGYPYGSVQDPRLVKIDNRFYMTYALRRFTGNATGIDNDLNLKYYTEQGFDPCPENNNTISGIAVSDDLINWENLGFCEPLDVDDRDLVLFPQKINDRYALLRRPDYADGTLPSITLSWSDSLENGGNWTKSKKILKPHPGMKWESVKTGACGPPIKTDVGWLLLYHGVDDRSVYRIGAAILDLENPEIVIAKTRFPIFEPSDPWEKLGAVFQNVVFPCGNIVKDDTLFIYYGAADTSICLATVKLQELVDFVMLYEQKPDMTKIFAEFVSL